MITPCVQLILKFHTDDRTARNKLLSKIGQSRKAEQARRFEYALKDDEIMLTTLSGSYRYRVDSTKVVEPEDIEVLDEDADDMLTLVTCYPFNFVGTALRRFIVRAHRIPE